MTADWEALLCEMWKSNWAKRCLGVTIKLPWELLPQLHSWLQNHLLFLHWQHHCIFSIKNIYLSNRILSWEALRCKIWKSYWEKRCLGFTIKHPWELLPPLHSCLQNHLLFLHWQHNCIFSLQLHGHILIVLCITIWKKWRPYRSTWCASMNNHAVHDSQFFADVVTHLKPELFTVNNWMHLWRPRNWH